MMKTDARVTYPDALPLKFPSRCGVSRPCGVTRNEQRIEDRSLRDLVHRRDLLAEKFARADMQLHQTDEFWGIEEGRWPRRGRPHRVSLAYF